MQALLIITYLTGELATRASWPPAPRPHQNQYYTQYIRDEPTTTEPTSFKRSLIRACSQGY
jgi:hypothetical protein